MTHLEAAVELYGHHFAAVVAGTAVTLTRDGQDAGTGVWDGETISGYDYCLVSDGSYPVEGHDHGASDRVYRELAEELEDHQRELDADDTHCSQ